jgi:predicted nucleic acid-binding protein
MISPDVNVLLYAHREDLDGHEDYARWLGDLSGSPEPFALPSSC